MARLEEQSAGGLVVSRQRSGSGVSGGGSNPQTARSGGGGPSGAPPGWVEVYDETAEATYYFNESTGETSWSMPQHSCVPSYTRPSHATRHMRPVKANRFEFWGLRPPELLPGITFE